MDHLIQKYPRNEYKIAGYSFGATFGHSVAYELQQRIGQDAVQSIIYMDWSPNMEMGRDRDAFREAMDKRQLSAFLPYLNKYSSSKLPEHRSNEEVIHLLAAIHGPVHYDMEFLTNTLLSKWQFQYDYSMDFLEDPKRISANAILIRCDQDIDLSPDYGITAVSSIPDSR